MLQRAKGMLRAIYIYEEMKTWFNIFPTSLYDGHGREIPLLLFGERALIS